SVGNRAGIARYAAQGIVSFEPYPGGSATVPVQVANPDLTWETTITTNVGLEFDMFNRRLRGVADYFIRDTKDLLFNVPMSYESGVGSVVGNVGDIQNKGLELSLQGDIVRTNDLTWTLGGNIIFLDHKIVSLPDDESIDAGNTFGIRWEEGRKINEHFYTRYAGVGPQTGRGMFYGGDDRIYFANELPDDMEHRVFQGKSSIADKEGGFFTNINYKGFGLRTDFVFKAGNWIYNAVGSQRESDGALLGSNQAVTAFNYGKQPGDNNVHPSPMYQAGDADIMGQSDRFHEKGDYIRMRIITLSYTFPKANLERTPINSLRLYLQGQNLLTFSKFWGDPEVGISSGETISYAGTVAPGEATLYSY